MFIDKDSIKVKISGMADYLSLGQYLVEVKYEFHKLYGNDAGRSLSGIMTGTLIGTFVKLTMQFRALNKEETEIIAPILDSNRQSLKYYDPNKKTTITMDTYTGDYEITDKDIVDSDTPNEGFSCAFIAVRKRV